MKDIADNLLKKDLEKQGYRLVGKHSAIKVCLWCKNALRGKGFCYKEKFYGIRSLKCIQASVSLLNCYHKCEFCWRDVNYTKAEDVQEPDNPKFIVDECIKAHKTCLQGFKAVADKQLFEEAMEPKHFALSLSGDATLYPRLNELIKEIHSRKMTSFLVTNGLRPDRMKELLKEMPTQTYITLPAPNEEIYLKLCRPLVNDGWRRLNESLNLLHKFDRSVIRMTLIRGVNLCNPEQYAEIIEKARPDFIELKAFMTVGHAMSRFEYSSMPLHKEILKFANEVCDCSGLQILDQKHDSRVVLLGVQSHARLDR